MINRVKSFQISTEINPIASGVPGGNRILIINIKAQQSALSKAIKTRFNLKIFNKVTFRLDLRHNVTAKTKLKLNIVDWLLVDDLRQDQPLIILNYKDKC